VLDVAAAHGTLSKIYRAAGLKTNDTKVERYRHAADPVSILDRNAVWGPWRAYPHTYTGFKELFDKPAPYLLDTGAKAGLTSFVV
jgi:hypothetical protein